MQEVQNWPLALGGSPCTLGALVAAFKPKARMLMIFWGRPAEKVIPWGQVSDCLAAVSRSMFGDPLGGVLLFVGCQKAPKLEASGGNVWCNLNLWGVFVVMSGAFHVEPVTSKQPTTLHEIAIDFCEFGTFWP